MRILINIILLAILTGCASSQFVQRDQVEFDHDPFTDTTTILGITQQVPGTANTWWSANYYFRTFTGDDMGEPLHQLYIDIRYVANNWRFYSRAELMDSDRPELTEIGTDVTCTAYVCSYTEVVGVTIDEQYLREHQSGFDVKLYARQGEDLVFNISQNQIRAQLFQIDQLAGQ